MPKTPNSWGIHGLRGTPYKGNYVYYNRLHSSKPDMAAKVYGSLTNALSIVTDLTQMAQYFRSLAEGEAKKESALLTQYFGAAPKDWTYDELLVALNETLQLKETFLRNYYLISTTKGKKGLPTWIGEYYEKTVLTHMDEIKELTILALSQQISDSEATSRITTLLENCMRETLIYMFQSTGGENKIIDGLGLADAYEPLVAALEDYSNIAGNTFIDQLCKNYHIDDIVNTIKTASYKSNPLRTKNFNISNAVHYRGGFNMEYLSEFMANTILSGLTGSYSNGELTLDVDAHGQAFGTGAKGGFSDITMTFSYDADFETVVKNAFNDATQNWEKYVERASSYNKLQTQLSQFDDSFIIYTSAKNYSTSGYIFQEKGGFAASAMTLDQIAGRMAAVGMGGSNAKSLIGLGMQLGEGAFLSGKKAEVETGMARMIAQFLFDDFIEVGKVNKSSTNNLHLLYLNGVYVPLSWFFNEMAEVYDAAAQEIGDPKQLINVTIDAPEILWPSSGNGAEKDPRTGHKYAYPHGNGYYDYSHLLTSAEAWALQGQYARANTKVTVNFLKDFKNLISKINIGS